MCEVLLINSPLYKNIQVSGGEDTLPPIGLGYIATHLQENFIKVKMIDAVFEKLTIENIFETIRKEKPKYVGLNIFSTNYEVVKEIVEQCNSEATFIIGGQVTKIHLQ